MTPGDDDDLCKHNYQKKPCLSRFNDVDVCSSNSAKDKHDRLIQEKQLKQPCDSFSLKDSSLDMD